MPKFHLNKLKPHFKDRIYGPFCILTSCKLYNYTELRSNLKHWLDKVVDDMSELVIKRKGQKDLVLISRDEYNSLKETAYLLSGNNRDVLLESINELESGLGIDKKLLK